MAMTRKTPLVTVHGWWSLTPSSRARLLETCIEGCGRKRAGSSERCAECNREHKRRATAERVARWRAKVGKK